ncbi:ABC transporter permease subunit [Arsenicicoccus sp. MKL-02]|uniref:ABC transporter permease subunit n=1 Tax=Arsenicicoccus cauae TaxID=2663847 RepID=A0A6I3IN94_9MICO|nr:ABC transporter permease [Arsenicicoccus cauae]MTB73115.1 ABC transporter permease subunit [Arsenicicoccus cauae]
MSPSTARTPRDTHRPGEQRTSSTRRAKPLRWRVELGRQVGRRRTAWGFGLLLALPLVLVAAFSLGDDGSGGGRYVDLAREGGPNFAVFCLFAASDFLLVILAALFAGDAVPSEASWSSLRYLLVAPVSRARLLTSKLVVALGSTALAAALLPAWALLVGGLAYGWAPYSSPIGTGLTWEQLLPRLALAAGIVAVNLVQVVGIALLIGTLNDAPLGAVGGAVLVTIVASILDTIEQLGDLRHALPMHYSRAWIRALSPDIAWTDIQLSALWSLIYGVATVAAAYWWFRRKDILS